MKRLVAAAAVGLGATFGMAACSSDTAPEHATVPAVCAEATSQAGILSEPQANTFMKAVGDCIFSLEAIAPAADRQEGSDTVTTNTTIAAGSAKFTLTDKPSSAGSIGWSIAENLISKASPENGQQTATEPYDITANFSFGNESTPAEWLARLQTNNLRDSDEIYGGILDNTSGMTHQQIVDASTDWDSLQQTTDSLLNTAEISILEDAS